MTTRPWRRLWVRGPAGERGAVAVAVALLFPILFGAAALAVDTAAVWNARTQVFSSVDAFALAAAMDCAEQDCPTKTEGETMISHYGITNNSGAKLASLQPGTGWLQTDTGQRATRGQGTWTIRHFFGAALGIPDVQLTVETMARWAGLQTATADLPVAVSYCAYQSAIGNGGVGSTRATATVSLSTVTTTSCNAPNGTAVRGTSALLQPTGSRCGTASTAGTTVTTATSAPAVCTAAYLNGLIGTDILLAVYDQSGSSSVRVYGYAALRVTSVSSGSPASVTGWFTYEGRQIDTPSTMPTAPDLGARGVFLWDPDDWQGTRCPC
ncbi:Putative Flp pilus-assembly TadE/G-like [Klenkia soli]|uniref:Putative Flp pilus-assembly TadE/G-like n=1 Tax=Klenkia soli TaxID=1052260 RepID=A0A1H0T1W8_9ACTN|nr:hypothetical protein [Klenkia soli]SDP47558.1 Putative Flp pilus-assembly TadE/G-like [Klenkia soli]